MRALEEVRDLAEAVARRRSLNLWDVEVKGDAHGTVVRVYVDAEGGVDLDTVAQVSEELSRGLDLKDPISGRYTLEVSSPGLERTLNRPEHFQACIGARVVVKTAERLATGSHRLEGTIVDADTDKVRVEGEEGELELPYAQVKSARTVFEW